MTGWSSELSFRGMHMFEGFVYLMLLAFVERDAGEAWGRETWLHESHAFVRPWIVQEQ